ncbi:hypothetical protein HDV00_003489 [Rhizophlyctis rosea]|nr:hypothetical protein HDV00_003489 [Rhizophlyctis rosea]
MAEKIRSLPLRRLVKQMQEQAPKVGINQTFFPPKDRTSKRMNGVGAYIAPCQRLTLRYAPETLLHGEQSKGLVSFILKDLPSYAQKHPHIEFRVEQSVDVHPTLIADYGGHDLSQLEPKQNLRMWHQSPDDRRKDPALNQWTNQTKWVRVQTRHKGAVVNYAGPYRRVQKVARLNRYEVLGMVSELCQSTGRHLALQPTVHKVIRPGENMLADTVEPLWDPFHAEKIFRP